MNILYLTLTRFNEAPYCDASTRYRCFHFAEDLRVAGHSADIAALDNLGVAQLPYYDVVCVLRPIKSKRLTKILKACQDLGILTIADFDDLLFSPEHAEKAPAVLSQQAAIRPMRQKFQQHLDALHQFAHVTVATQPLAQHVERLHPTTSVGHIPNGLSRYWMDSNRYLDNATITQSTTITYLPGSRSHNADFSYISDTLSEILNDHSEVTLHIVGELDFNSSAFRANQLRQSAWIDYVRLPSVTRNSLVTIAPLEDSEFNQCKSHIKFIESAAFGTPVITSAIPDIERHPPLNGLYLANNKEDWETALTQIINAKSTSTHRTELQQYARSQCMNQLSLNGLLAFMGFEAPRNKDVSNTLFANAS